jgi:hypothetical protein
MGKVKTIYRILVPVLLVVGMALSPFPAMEMARASSVSNVGSLSGYPSPALPLPR